MATMNFKNVPVKKPRKEPKAAFVAVFLSALFNNSPTKAPTKGQIIIPKGPRTGKNKATNKPMVVPVTPAFVPPNFLVPMAGIT